MMDDSQTRDAARPTGRTASRVWVASLSFLATLAMALCGQVMAQGIPEGPLPGSGIVRNPPPPNGASRMAYAHGQAVRSSLHRRGFGYADPRARATVRAIANASGGHYSNLPGTRRMIRLMARRHPVMTGVAVTSNLALLYVAGSFAVDMLADQDPENYSPVIGGSIAWGATSGTYLYPTREAAVLGHVERSYNFLRVKTLVWGTPSETPPGSIHPYAYPASVTVVQSETTNPTTGEVTEHTQFLGTFTVRAYLADTSCGPGQMLYSQGANRTCLASNVSPGLYAPGAVSYANLEDWYDANANQNLNAALTPEFVAETANQAWRDAALAPGFSGVPWSAANPVRPTDVASDAIPTLGALGEPAWDPALIDPYSNPDALENPPVPEDAQHVIVDFGEDPGIGEPVLEEPPTGIMDPLLDALDPLFNVDFGMTAEACPTWSESVAVAGYTFDIDLVDHCTLIEPWYSVIYSFSAALWMVGAVFVVLRA